MSEENIRTMLTEALEFLDKVFGYSEMDEPEFAERIHRLHNTLTQQQKALDAGTPPSIEILSVFFSENGALPRLAAELQCEGQLDDCVTLFQSLT